VCDRFPRHATNANGVDYKDSEEEKDADGAQDPLPFFDKDAVEHGH
jgi:hypothetical protein